MRAVVVHVSQIGGRERVFFDRQVDQPIAASRVAPPRRPGGEEVVAQAEASLEDHVPLLPGPARVQLIASQKHLLGLRQRAPGGVVGRAEIRGERQAVGAAAQAGGKDRVGASHEGRKGWVSAGIVPAAVR